MQAHQLLVQRTAHYYTLGTVGVHVKQLWIVCHGYAQLADEFLECFRSIDDGSRLIIAPEGMNYFYKKGFSGPVGANWMTRHKREEAIVDYSNYLQNLLDLYRTQLDSDVRVVILGFSQGTATVCRWVMAKNPAFQDLMLWAGLPPEDIDYAGQKEYLKNKNLYLLYGTNDPFLTPDRMSVVSEIEQKNGIDFSETPFEGGHEISEEALQKIIAQLN